jgi:hypothetical protein
MKRKEMSKEEDEFRQGSRRKYNKIEFSDLPDDVVVDHILDYVNDEVNPEIAMVEARRQKFRVEYYDESERDPEIKYRYLLRTVSGLTDELKIKLKVFLCLNPEYVIKKNALDVVNVEALTAGMDLVRPETRVLDESKINVVYPLGDYMNFQILPEYEHVELYIMPQYVYVVRSVNVVFYSFLLELGDNFCQDNIFEKISYRGMTSLRKVGNKWMADNDYLREVDFRGLGKLKQVRDRWLSCNIIEAPSFDGLSALTIVGSCWMKDCPELKNPRFRGLERLRYVGNEWMSNCDSLVRTTFEGLSHLERVGSGWMSYCDELESPSYMGLSALKRVGNDWMAQCGQLISPSFEGLSKLTTVDEFWMGDCAGLQSPDFSGLIQLRSVGKYWMWSCDLLTDATRNYVRIFRENHPLVKEEEEEE